MDHSGPHVLDEAFSVWNGVRYPLKGPHVHRCLSHVCQGRTWACTGIRCQVPLAQQSCEICDPPTRGGKPCRCGCRQSGRPWTGTGSVSP
jgi:hypothetical protein